MTFEQAFNDANFSAAMIRHKDWSREYYLIFAPDGPEGKGLYLCSSGPKNASYNQVLIKYNVTNIDIMSSWERRKVD